MNRLERKGPAVQGGAGNDDAGAIKTSYLPDSLSERQAQFLVAVHAVPIGLAPVIAHLAFGGAS
jgi:hypothetical protein